MKSFTLVIGYFSNIISILLFWYIIERISAILQWPCLDRNKISYTPCLSFGLWVCLGLEGIAILMTVTAIFLFFKLLCGTTAEFITLTKSIFFHITSYMSTDIRNTDWKLKGGGHIVKSINVSLAIQYIFGMETGRTGEVARWCISIFFWLLRRRQRGSGVSLILWRIL